LLTGGTLQPEEKAGARTLNRDIDGPGKACTQVMAGEPQ